MRIAYIVPKDRTMTREVWKTLDRMLRKVAREVQPDIERAYREVLLYGRSRIAIRRDGCRHIGTVEVYGRH